jgi:hypothetical protein
VRRILLVAALGLASALWPAGLRACQPAPKAEAEPSCGNHGTAVQFVDSPSDAARQARQQEKLVFVLHVSGLFEDPGLT